MYPAYPSFLTLFRVRIHIDVLDLARVSHTVFHELARTRELSGGTKNNLRYGFDAINEFNSWALLRIIENYIDVKSYR